MRLKFSCHDLVFYFDAFSDCASGLQARILDHTPIIMALIQPGSILKIRIYRLIGFGEHMGPPSIDIATCRSNSLATHQLLVKCHKTGALIRIEGMHRLVFVVESLLGGILLERDRRGFAKQLLSYGEARGVTAVPW